MEKMKTKNKKHLEQYKAKRRRSGKKCNELFDLGKK